MTEVDSPLRLAQCSAAALPAFVRAHAASALGVVSYGAANGAAGATGLDCPVAHIHHPHLDGPASSEVWLGGRCSETLVSARGARYRHDGDVLFGVAVADAPDGAIEAAGHQAYAAMLDCIAHAGYPKLLRVWNTLPWINANELGLERYRAFNRSRFRAFSEAGMPTHTGAPAASALGAHDGPLSVHFLAARDGSVVIENPRQVSAYDYPQEHGPRAPNFSRAALWRNRVLFVSGTASIVGHESLHPGDVRAQADETARNLRTLVERCSARTAHGPKSLADLCLKVYLRRPSDLAAVRAQLAGQGVDPGRVLYVHADICRAELLVEIEAVGPRALLLEPEVG